MKAYIFARLYDNTVKIESYSDLSLGLNIASEMVSRNFEPHVDARSAVVLISSRDESSSLYELGDFESLMVVGSDSELVSVVEGAVSVHITVSVSALAKYMKAEDRLREFPAYLAFRRDPLEGRYQVFPERQARKSLAGWSLLAKRKSHQVAILYNEELDVVWKSCQTPDAILIGYSDSIVGARPLRCRVGDLLIICTLG
jgi:hypothetical protein